MQAKLGEDNSRLYSTALGCAADMALAGFLPLQPHTAMCPEYSQELPQTGA